MVRAKGEWKLWIRSMGRELLAYSHRLLHFGKLGLIHDGGFNLILSPGEGCAVKVAMEDAKDTLLAYEGSGNCRRLCPVTR